MNANERKRRNKQEIERKRLSVDLAPYPDVLNLVERAERDNPGVPRTYFIVNSLRAFLPTLLKRRPKAA